MATQFAFVSVDGSKGKVKAEDRELVRSRCMKGKNKKEDSRRSVRERARQETTLPRRTRQRPSENAPPTSLVNYSYASSSSSSSSSTSSSASESSTSDDGHEWSPTKGANGQFVSNVSLVASLHREMVRFMHEDTPTYPREMIFVSQTLKDMKELSYPIYGQLYFHDKMTKPPLEWLVIDSLFRYSVLYHIAVAKACEQKQPLSEETLRYHQITLNLLNKKLSGPAKGALTNTVLWSINMLANTAHLLARYDEVDVHTRALRRICGLYGGPDFIAKRPTLRYYIYALELASSLGSGITQINDSLDSPCDTYDAPVMEEKTPPRSLPLSDRILLTSMSVMIDARIISIFRDLQEVTHRFNESRARGERLDASTYQAFHNSASSRLLRLKDSLGDVTSECVRLGLLAYLTLGSFRVLQNRLGHARNPSIYPYLGRSFRTACLAIDLDTPQLSTLMLWLLTIGSMSVFNIDEEPWLAEKWREAAQVLPGVLVSWEAALEQLDSVMWMNSVLDEMGFQMYQKLVKKSW
ncbi:hypothetical protein GGS20DRAFT_552222 [Poronia punctata]|nr:hypothetical protein GGS20DRAFT_552222 [Poronia punctata]